MVSEVAQEIYEYSRRGRFCDLMEVIDKAHPDEYVAYDGSTALLMACRNGHREVCALLISRGADASQRTDEGSSALLLACCSGSIDLVTLILSTDKCEVNAANEDGFTPIDMARHYNHTHIVEYLRSRGGEFSETETPEYGEVPAGPSEKWGYGVFDQ